MGATIPGRGEASAQARRLKCTGGFQSWAGGGQGEREGGREEVSLEKQQGQRVQGPVGTGKGSTFIPSEAGINPLSFPYPDSYKPLLFLRFKDPPTRQYNTPVSNTPLFCTKGPGD